MPFRADMPLTKIIATVGPSCRHAERLCKLIEAGVSVFRLNFSHADLDAHCESVERIRSAAEAAGLPIAILGDLRGPRIRIAAVPDGGIRIKQGDRVTFSRETRIAGRSGSEVRFASTYDGLIDDVRSGERILIDDGRIRLLVIDRSGEALSCVAITGGIVTSGKGINLPDSTVSVPALGDRDRRCVRWALKQELDFIALSFVRGAGDVDDLRAEIESHPTSSPLPIIAKVEHPAAVANIDAILNAADGIMVARGDLGMEMDLARVPVVQKQLIEAAQAHGKPVIIATQMLESMIDSPVPTRAEVSDIATAIFAAVDAVMLSGETAIGQHPVLAVDHVRLTALHTEAYMASQPQRAAPPQRLVESRHRTAALAHGAWTLAQDYGARFIVVWSQLGGGARLLSQNNFSIPLIAVSSDQRALRRMQLLRGVRPVYLPTPSNRREFIEKIERTMLDLTWAARGDRYVLMDGPVLGKPKVTDRISLRAVGLIDP